MKKAYKNRLVFILIIFITVTIFYVSGAVAQEKGKQITILFTHDLHDNFLPLKDEQDGLIIESGGYARLQSAINAERRKDPAALVVDAGDFSMGTPFQTIFTKESPGLRLMGMMGYDAVTLGNHEYDYRAQGLADSLNSAEQSGEKLPYIVQSNVIFPTDQKGGLTPSLSKLQQAYQSYGIKDYVVIEKNGVKVGVFGLMGEDAASKAPMSEVEFADPVETAKSIVKMLKKQEKVDLIICLSHSGLWPEKKKSEDEILAAEVPDIDVIISAHTHTKLQEPIVVGKTIIGSTEDSGKYLGVLKVIQDSALEWKLDSYHLQHINEDIPKDPGISKIIDRYKRLVDENYFSLFNMNFDQVLAVAPFGFDTVDKIYQKHGESPLGNLISDAYTDAVRKAEGVDYTPVDAAIVPLGTIRSSFFQGKITVGDVFSVSSLGIGPDRIPGYPLISVYLTGKELKTVCEVDASVSPIMDDAQLFISGLSFTFNPHRMIFNKVTRVSLQRPDGSLQEIDDQKLYRVVAGLYSAQMLSVVGEKSFGLLSLVPKTKDGIPIKDFEAQIIRDTTSGNNNEVKEWLAIAHYLQSFPKADGVAQIPQYYNQTHGRKVVDDNKNISALVSSPNRITLTVYGIIFAAISLISFILYKIAIRKIPILREKAN
ncbi:MAG: bifunctional metallophosphatase/5'-nucleotidase [Bacillota bacterium]